MWRRPILLSVVLVGAVGCGGIAVFVDDGEGGGGAGSVSSSSGGPVATTGSSSTGGLDCEKVIADFEAPTLVCLTDSGACELSGTLPDGRTMREECDATPNCVLYIDEVLACTCPPERIDWANVCSGGIPTCSGWQFNFSGAAVCPPN